jgi:uncharacterized protein
MPPVNFLPLAFQSRLRPDPFHGNTGSGVSVHAGEIEMPRILPITAMICLSVATLSVLGEPATARAQLRQPAEQRVATVTVTGEGEARLTPDLAIVQLGVTEEAETARQALSANNQAMSRVIAAMKEAGIEARDLQTSSFSIQPRYHFPNQGRQDQEPPRIVGYIVSNVLTVRVRHIAKVGEILDMAVTLGVNSDGNIMLTNEDPSQAIEQARIAAMNDARDRAATLAEAAGVKLGSLLEISENTQRPAPYALNAQRMEMKAADAVPVEPGENTYAINVQASWEILQ